MQAAPPPPGLPHQGGGEGWRGSIGTTLPAPRCHPGLEPGSILRSRHNRKVDRSSPIHPSHRTALGLDPRATHSPAQAANGPRVKPEDGPVSMGGYDATYPSYPPGQILLHTPPITPRGGLQANSGGVSRVGALPLPQVRVRAEACARPPVLFQKPAPRDGERLTIKLLRGVSRLGVRLV